MKSISTDPRAQRTRHALRRALMTLVVGKPFRNLTIRDITNEARVNRATFYLHYDDKYDLLQDCANTLFEEIRREIEPKENFNPIEMLNQAVGAHGQRMAYLLKHLQKYSAFYKAMFRTDGEPLFYNMFRDNASTWITSQVKMVLQAQNRSVDDDLIEMMVRFQSAGNFDVISWWLENDMRVPIDIMATRLEMITLPPIIRILTDNPRVQQ